MDDCDITIENCTVGENALSAAFVENIAQQLKIAGRVQRDFLPANLPDNEKLKWDTLFLPAEYVSGDIYDVARIDEEHIGFYIADVVGHGIPAALLTIFVKQALAMRETFGNSYQIFSPGQVMEKLNRRIIEQKLSDHQFITCCYCLLNTKRMHLTYARAGHPYPLIVHSNGTIDTLDAKGALLGVFEKAEFQQATVQLREGDKVIIYSDGTEPYIGDFEDEKGFVFGDFFRSIAQLPVSDFTCQLKEAILKEAEGKKQFDDITTVGLEVLNAS